LSRSRRLFGVAIVAAAILLFAPAPRAAEDDPYRTGFFRLKESIPEPIATALAAYEKGAFFETLASLDRLPAKGATAYAQDDARMLRALALVALGWTDLAAPLFVSIVEANPPSPYYVPALLGLVEIHDHAGRWKATADAWERHFDQVRGSRKTALAKLLYEFGALRPPSEGSTRAEKSWLSRPKELAVIRADRKEREGERLVYRSGLALLRVGQYDESFRTLLRVAIDSPYYPYARYTMAQDLFALGRKDDAVRTLVLLARFPMVNPQEQALATRARLLHARMLIEQKDVDGAINVARGVGDADAEAPAARLLVASALLEKGEPALSLVYANATAPPLVDVEAKQALTKGAAYASLGDRNAATEVLRDAVGRVRKERAQGATLAKAGGELRDYATRKWQARRDREQAERAHLASGMRIVLAWEGPWNLGTILRRLRATLGAGPYRELALGSRITRETGETTTVPWALPYLTSERQRTIELVLDRVAGIEKKSVRTDFEGLLQILDGYLLYVEQAPVEESSRVAPARAAIAYVDRLRSTSVEIPELGFDGEGTLAMQATAYRHRLARSLGEVVGASPVDVGSLDAERAEVVALLRRWIDHEVEEVLNEREAELRDLELDLDVMLGETLAASATGAEPPPKPGAKK